MPTPPASNRRYLRYRDPDMPVVQLVRLDDQGGEHATPALVKNESHGGFACVVVGPPPGPAERFAYQENEKIRSGLVLRHHHELEDDIQLLGFELTGEITHT
ncbi:hypothetical protein GF314_13450 [bacterium]|nr:hypothetical protein [bacterium]